MKNVTIFAVIALVGGGFVAADRAAAGVACKRVGYPKGCIATPAAHNGIGVRPGPGPGKAGVGLSPGVGPNLGGPVNRIGVR